MIKRLSEPLQDRKGLVTFLSIVFVLQLIFVFAIVIGGLFSLPELSFESVGFHLLRTFSLLSMADYFFLVVFPFLAALLWVHYQQAKCSPDAKNVKICGSAGAFAGLITAGCPLCLIPLLGVTASVSILAPVVQVIKWVGLLLLVGALVMVVRKKSYCKG